MALPLPHQRDGLALGKDCADIVEWDVLRARQRKLADLEQGYFQGARDDLHEAPRASRALVVHEEVGHVAPLVHANRLAVLPAHVEDCRDPRHEPVRPTAMTAD